MFLIIHPDHSNSCLYTYTHSLVSIYLYIEHKSRFCFWVFYFEERWWCIHLLRPHLLQIQLLFVLRKLQVNFLTAQIGPWILIFVMPSISIIGLYFTPISPFFFLCVIDFYIDFSRKNKREQEKLGFFIHGYCFVVDMCGYRDAYVCVHACFELGF